MRRARLPLVPARRIAARRFAPWRRGSPPLLPWVPILAIGLAALVLVLATYPGFRFGRTGPSGLLIPGPIVNATVSVGPKVGVHPADPFFSIVFQTGNSPVAMLRQTGAFFNSTPITLFRFGGGGEAYDPTTGTLYEAPSGGGQYIATPAPPNTWNLTWMRAWCGSRVPSCAWLGYLPAEENNTQAAVHTAQWYHSVLGFVPTYWQLGNEPEAWLHYGENRTQWSTYDASTPTGLAYATMVRNYIEAIRAIYPTDQFVGIEASSPGGGSGGFVSDTAELAGSLVGAMAYHTYPWIDGSSSDLSQFFGTLASNSNVSATASVFRSGVLAGCPSCESVPIQIGEFQAGPAGALNPFALTYAGAPFIAAAIIEALRANVSTFTPFDESWLLDPTDGAVLPEGLLYQRILENMTMGTDFATSVSAIGVGGIYSVLTQNGTHESLLVVNANTTHSIRLTLPPGPFENGSVGSYWLWGPSVADPIPDRSVAFPSAFEVPEEGILLLDNY